MIDPTSSLGYLDSVFISPRSSYRQLARYRILPLLQISTAVLISYLAADLGLPWLACFVYGVSVCVGYAVDDLSVPQSGLFKFYHWIEAKIQTTPQELDPDLAQETIVFSSHGTLFSASQRRYIRWITYVAILLANAGFSLFIVWHTTTDSLRYTVLIYLILFSSLMPYTVLANVALGSLNRNRRRLLWGALIIVGIVVLVWTNLHISPDDGMFVASAVIVVFFVYFFNFVTTRISMGGRLKERVVQAISLHSLDWAITQDKQMNDIARLVGEELQHDRVFVLQYDPQTKTLRVKGEYINSGRSIIDVEAPLDRSLTGRAFTTQQAVAWNNVEECPYFFRPYETDDTKAEIAVPIINQGKVFGILDVQSVYPDSYGPSDIDALETIALILGTALALDARERFFSEALTLTELLNRKAEHLHQSEKSAFEEFAQFAQDYLDADLVIYYPLSLTGVPTRQPYTAGAFYGAEPTLPHKSHTQNALIHLVSHWQTIHEEEIAEDSVFAQFTEPRAVSFVAREKITSACFVPIGSPQEPLGGLFLNYRSGKLFDETFRFTLTSLAQTFGRVVGRFRTYEVYFKTFGRPEIELHNMINRRGLKGGVTSRAKILMHNCPEQRRGRKGQDCCLQELLKDVDGFIEDVALAKSAMAPSFWQRSLYEELQDYKLNLPTDSYGRQVLLNLKLEELVLEYDPPWLKLALYRIITEAINNAIFHGRADRIEVAVERHESKINVSVTNNGVPLPDTAPELKSRHGIYHLLEELRKQTGAIASISRQSNNVGTQVLITILALPLSIRKTSKGDEDNDWSSDSP